MLRSNSFFSSQGEGSGGEEQNRKNEHMQLHKLVEPHTSLASGDVLEHDIAVLQVRAFSLC